ncbi:MAG: lysophospholipase [Bacteriovoracaceae bacterium]|nr:lysophospholipase [Bacteriovoracaceae bacterium]
MQGEQHFIKMRDEVELHAEIYERGNPRWLIVTHGIGEHLGRHSYIKELFSSAYNILYYDLRGHGLSMGEDAFIHDFQDYIQDLDQIIAYLKSRYRMERYCLFGHSMGALITASFMQRQVKPDFYPEKVYLNAPPVGFGGPAGPLISWSPRSVFSFLAKNPVSVRLGGLVDLGNLSHDPRVKENYKFDSKNHMTLHTKLLLEMVKCSGETFCQPIKVKCPAYVSVGSEDKIVNPKELIDYFENIEKGFQLRVFDGAYHEIHNEIEKYRTPYFEYLKDSFLDYL